MPSPLDHPRVSPLSIRASIVFQIIELITPVFVISWPRLNVTFVGSSRIPSILLCRLGRCPKRVLGRRSARPLRIGSSQTNQRFETEKRKRISTSLEFLLGLMSRDCLMDRQG